MMRLRYLPRLALNVDRLSEAVGKRIPGGADRLRVADVDEDEATLAVEALRALLARAEPGPDDVARVRVEGDMDERQASIVGQAVFGDADRVVVERPGATAPEDGLVVGVRVRVVRAASADLFKGRGSFAEAFLPDSVDEDPEIHEPAGVHELPVSTDRLDALTRADETALGAVPMGAHVPEVTWEAGCDARYRLLVGACADGHTHFPPRRVCPTCGSEAEPRPAPRHGRVHTLAVIAEGGGPTEFDFLQEAWGSYASLIVEPDGLAGTRIPGLGADAAPEDFGIGGRVEAVFRRIYATEGRWRYGTKFRPAPKA